MVAGSVKTLTLFTLVWGLERFTLTLSNICMVAFLTNLSKTIHMAVIGSIYMVIQVKSLMEYNGPFYLLPMTMGILGVVIIMKQYLSVYLWLFVHCMLDPGSTWWNGEVQFPELY